MAACIASCWNPVPGLMPRPSSKAVKLGKSLGITAGFFFLPLLFFVILDLAMSNSDIKPFAGLMSVTSTGVNSRGAEHISL